ncbi:MAG: hypothetical protein RIT27_551 [Pseudomonadota bacterium]|jgi:hypothetical protein
MKYRIASAVLSASISLALHAQESHWVDYPTPMEWYRGCTTTATSMLLDWFGQHGYSNLSGNANTTSYSGCPNAIIRGDIANLFANSTRSSTGRYSLTCSDYGVYDNDFVSGISSTLQSYGYKVNTGGTDSWQVLLGGSNGSFGIEDLVATIDRGMPMIFMLDANKFNSPNDPDFGGKRNHAVLVYGYSGYSGPSTTNVRVDLLSGWSSTQSNAYKNIVLERSNSGMLQQAVVVIPPNNPDARMITRSSAINKILSAFSVSSSGVNFSGNQPSDINSSTPFYSDIAYGYAKGILNGYSDGTYRPLNTVNRAEFIKMVMETLNRAFGVAIENPSFQEPVNVFGQYFPDMNYGSDWFYKYVKAAYNYKIIQGTNEGYLLPGIKLSETEARLILERAATLVTTPNNELGVDLTAYCRSVNGSSSVAVLTRNDVNGWACLTNGNYSGMSDLNSACKTQYGNTYEIGYRNFNDPYSWYCKSSETPVSSANFWTGNGSIINYHGIAAPANSGDSEYPFGIKEDTTILHSRTDMPSATPVALFQWQANKGNCDIVRFL